MTEQSFKTISVQELKELIDQEPQLCLIDVRELHEWKMGRIPGAILIPKDEITVCIQDKVNDQNQAIYLHCRSGVRSAFAAQCLAQMGYKDVYSVEGGIMDWAMAGYPVEE